MHTTRLLAVLTIGLALPFPAFADRGAVSLDVGAGASVVSVDAPYSDTKASQAGSAPALWIGGRYAITNSVELTATAFAETSVPYYVSGTTITSDAGALSGTLQMRARRFGLLAGARFLHGNVWRLVLAADAGWALSSYNSLHLLYDADPAGPRDYGLKLSDATTNALVLAPGAGVSWVGDKLSITVLPRFEVLLGGPSNWALTIPLTV